MIKEDIPSNALGDGLEKGYIFDPFGPHYLYVKIKDSLRLNLLNMISNIKNNSEIKDKNDLTKEPTWNRLLKATITNGESYGIPPSVDENNVMLKLLTTLTSHYSGAPLSEVGYVEAWYVIMKPGDFHLLHSHEAHERMFSGAIYLQIPDMEFPQGNINWVLGGQDSVGYRSHYYHVPKNGDVLMWPSWLKHDVYPYKSDNQDTERIMISFNTGLKEKDWERKQND